MRKIEKILVLFIVSFFIFNIKVSYSPSTTLIPIYCLDSDGDCNVNKIRYLDGSYELVDLLFFPYGWIVVESFEGSIPEKDDIDLVTLHTYWYTDVGEGANNIYFEYHDGNSWNYCAGPYSERGELTYTTCNIPITSRTQLQNLKIRIRGEDYDGFPMAFLYVDQIYLQVNHSSPPIWRNQKTNVSTNLIFSDESILLSAEIFDDVGIACAWLSTNETGIWKNYTHGEYNSPICFNGISNTWVNVNFTWKNSSFVGIVGWKICFNDTTNKENCTEENYFRVEYRSYPVYCLDSDGDCNAERIKYLDGKYELVDLLVYPYGWIIASNFTPELPDKIIIRNITLHVYWYTDVGEGANNIYFEYHDGNSWNYCAGPYSERGELTYTTCNIPITSRTQLQNLKIRIRGEDYDGFPMAFLYVDQIFISTIFTIGAPYLEVHLNFPKPLKVNNIVQNSTFIVNATVYCRDGECGKVYATILYNKTSENPDSPVSTIFGDVPFFIQEDEPYSTKKCQKENLVDGDYCNIFWIVNASGEYGSFWKIAVLFNSSNPDVKENITKSAIIYIGFCTVDFTLSWEILDFGQLIPNTYRNPALGNSKNLYKITLGPTSCNLNIYIKGTDLVGNNYGYKILVSNISVSNITNIFETSFRLTNQNQLLFYNVSSGEYYTYYWIDLPPIYADTYKGEIFIVGVESEES